MEDDEGASEGVLILLKILVSAAGFEPATHALKGHCSTN